MEKIQEILDRAGVDRAVVFADPESANIPDDNDYVLEVTSKNDHIPFYYIGGNAYSTNRAFPNLPDPRVLDPYMGIKWHCWFSPGHDFGGTRLGMDDSRIEEVLTEGARTGLCRDVGVPAAASMLFGAFQSTVLDWVADGCSYTLTDITGELTEFVLYGICRADHEERGAAQ